MPIPALGLIPGEPAGIGPELCVRLVQQPLPARLIAFADPDNLLRAARALQLPLKLIDTADLDANSTSKIGELAIQPCPQPTAVAFGQPAAENARSVIAALTKAAQHCLDGLLDGLVTGPIHKAAINAGGIAYTGTTELLAQHAGREVVMMLANPTLRVALATTHLPLRAVPDAITFAGLTRTIEIVDQALRTQFGIAKPRIAVLGLNPHAGEAGVLGREEIDIITPVLDTLRRHGKFDLIGPLPADTAFLPAKLRECDAVLAMYHDQGLPVLKHAGFEQAVNITLGLPYPRVAVDHGTALEIAGRGLADPSSLIAAVHQCARLAEIRRQKTEDRP